jgi:hypothetical protein
VPVLHAPTDVTGIKGPGVPSLNVFLRLLTLLQRPAATGGCVPDLLVGCLTQSDGCSRTKSNGGGEQRSGPEGSIRLLQHGGFGQKKSPKRCRLDTWGIEHQGQKSELVHFSTACPGRAIRPLQMYRASSSAEDEMVNRGMPPVPPPFPPFPLARNISTVTHSKGFYTMYVSSQVLLETLDRNPPPSPVPRSTHPPWPLSSAPVKGQPEPVIA